MANEIISITVSEDLANQLHERAWGRNITTNRYIRGLIEPYTRKAASSGFNRARP